MLFRFDGLLFYWEHNIYEVKWSTFKATISPGSRTFFWVTVKTPLGHRFFLGHGPFYAYALWHFWIISTVNSLGCMVYEKIMISRKSVVGQISTQISANFDGYPYAVDIIWYYVHMCRLICDAPCSVKFCVNDECFYWLSLCESLVILK